jgi:PPM family protein phosphatase
MEMFSEEKISAILQTEHDPETACKRLIAEANQARARDNITAIIAHFHASKNL